MLKAMCEGIGPCGYTVRLTAKWVQDVGPPHCPKHGAMTVEMPTDEERGEEPGEGEGPAIIATKPFKRDGRRAGAAT